MYSERNYFKLIKNGVDCAIIAGLLNEDTLMNGSPKRWSDRNSDFVIEMRKLGQGAFGIVWHVNSFEREY